MALTKISTAMISQSASAVDLNIDAGTLYVDATNNRVGVGGKTDPDTPLHVTGTVTATLFAGSGASLTGIPNGALTNSSITINSSATSLGGSITLTTANIAENTNLYYTNARADARIAAADTNDLSEGSSNLYYTDARVDARVAGGSLGNITTTGYIRGPATFTIDPATHADNTGTVVIAGNLQVDGTQTTINSTTLTVDDKNITLASGSANASAASGAGFTVDIGTGTNPSITYDGTNDEWDFNKPLNVTGAITTSGNISKSSGDLTLDVAGDIILDAGGQNWFFDDDGTRVLSISQVSSDVYIGTEQNDKDLIFRGKDGASTITALTLDMSDGGAAIFGNDIFLSDGRAARFGNDQDFRIYNDGSHTTLHNATINQDMLFKGNDDGSAITALTLDMSNAGKATFSGIVSSAQGFERGNMFITSNEIDVGSGNLTLDVAGDIILDADSGAWRFKDNGGSIIELSVGSGSSPTFYAPVANADIIFKGNDSDGSNPVTALTLDMSEGGNAIFNQNITAGQNIVATANNSVIQTPRVSIEADGTIDWGASKNYGTLTWDTNKAIIKGQANSSLELQVNNSTTAVAFDTSGNATFGGEVRTTNINTASSTGTLTIYGGATNPGGKIVLSGGNNTGATGSGIVFHAGASTANPAERMRITSAGNVEVLGGAMLRAYRAGNSAYAGLFMDSGEKLYIRNSWGNKDIVMLRTGEVGIGTASPGHILHVKKPGSGDSTLMLETVSGGDPTIILNSAAANRSGLLKFQDNGANVGRIEYVHNGDRIDFQAGSATSATMSVKNGKVGIGTTAPVTTLDVGSTNLGLPATSGSDFNGLARIGYNDRTWTGSEMIFGIINAGAQYYAGYVQMKQPQNQATNRPFLVNPQGGNVGIGTDTPVYKLVVSNGGAAGIEIQPEYATDANLIQHYDRTASAYMDVNHIAQNHRFGRGAVEHMRINSAGNVGIGTNNPDSLLHLKSTGDTRMTIESPDANDAYINFSGATNEMSLGFDKSDAAMYITNHGTITANRRVTIKTTGQVGIGTTAPVAPLHVNVPGNSDGYAVGGKNLSLTTGFQTGAQLEITLGDHQGCYVKVFVTGDWSSHSAMAFMGEYFIQNGANAYAEPGMIIREVENTHTVDSLSSQIYDGGDVNSFQIQFKLNRTHGATTATGALTYQVMGQFDSIT